MKVARTILTDLANRQRDHEFRKQKAVRKGSGFDEILRKEGDKYGFDIEADNGQPQRN